MLARPLRRKRSERGLASGSEGRMHFEQVEALLRRVVQWAANVSHGKKDLRQSLTPAEFVVGGTIGPCAK